MLKIKYFSVFIQPLYSKITPSGIAYFLGDCRMALIWSALEPIGLPAGPRKRSMSENSTASAPFSSNVMMHGHNQAGSSVVEGFCALYSAR